MRTLTPQNAAFQPSGITPTSGLPIASKYTLTEDVNGDFAPISAPFYTPNDGVYIWTILVKVNTASAAGNLSITVTQPLSGTTLVLGVNLATLGLTATTQNFTIDSAGGIINVEREVTGFAGGPANYTVWVTAFILAP